MTIEKAKVKTFDVLRFVADNAGLSIFEAIEKAYNMGVSEQVAVLAKIRAEIEALPKTYPFINHFDTYVKEDDVKKIIDKYRENEE